MGVGGRFRFLQLPRRHQWIVLFRRIMDIDLILEPWYFPHVLGFLWFSDLPCIFIYKYKIFKNEAKKNNNNNKNTNLAFGVHNCLHTLKKRWRGWCEQDDFKVENPTFNIYFCKRWQNDAGNLCKLYCNKGENWSQLFVIYTRIYERMVYIWDVLGRERLHNLVIRTTFTNLYLWM